MFKKTSRFGFTLIEMLMAIVLMGIIATIAALTMYHASRSFQQSDVRGYLTDEARLAIDRISREMMLLRCTQSGASCNPQSTDITLMLANDVRFVNIENSGRGFRLNAGGLMMRQGVLDADPEDTLAANVSSLAFSYLDRNGAAAATVADIWTIGVNMTFSNSGETLDFTVKVHPRKFR